MKYYPVFLNLKGKTCIVVGGGKVAERKVKSLIDAEADVVVISPELTEKLKILKNRGYFRHIARSYQKGDLKEAFLVIAATSDIDINRMIFEEASQKPLNVVDMPELCTFIVPSVVRKGLLTIAISTSGASPAFAKSLRLELQDLIPDDVSAFLEYLYNIRTELKGVEGAEFILKEIGSHKILRILLSSGLEEAKKEVKRVLKENKVVSKWIS